MRNLLILAGVIAIIASGIFFVKSYDKYTNYYNPSSSSNTVNAYVGGDAYNYIINGTYFTGFSILGMGSLILSFLCFGVAAILHSLESLRLVTLRIKETPKEYF